jgi:hypothetical protein
VGGSLEIRPSQREVDRDFMRITAGLRLELPHDRASDAATSRNRAWVIVALLVALVSVVSVRIAVAARPASATACAPLRFVVDPAGAPVGVEPTVVGAFQRLTAATGLRARGGVGGRVDENTVVVKWIDGRRLVALAAQPDAVGFTEATKGPRLSGAVYLRADARLPVGFADRRTWGAVLMHELGHLVGLRHSTDPGEVMYAHVGAGPAVWGPTDRAQLAAAGRRLGCSVPPVS